MTRNKARRARLGMTWFALALGALALLAMPALAAAKDRNHDHIPDKWEKKHHLSLKVNQAHKNQDGDALRNRAEFLAGDNPRNADSNGDGVMDGEDNAGTIASFDTETGKLTINLFGGETVSGLVTEETELKCEDHSGATATSSSAGSDGSGSGEEEAGDDSGGETEQVEPGEDSGEEEAGDDSGQSEEEPADGSGGEEAGEDSGGDSSGSGSESSGSEDGEQSNCTTADLTPGAVVQEAELKVANGQATFEKVELSGKEA